jgi:hypothetical protein
MAACRYRRTAYNLCRLTSRPRHVIANTTGDPLHAIYGPIVQLVVTAGSSWDQLACLVWLGAALATRKVAGGSNLATRRSHDHARVTEAWERADKGLCKSIAFRQLPSCHDVYVT